MSLSSFSKQSQNSCLYFPIWLWFKTNVMPQSLPLNIEPQRAPNLGDYNFSQLLKETKKDLPKEDL